MVMGSVVVDVFVRGSGGGGVRLRALVDTGFYGGDVIAIPGRVQGLGMEFRYGRVRRLSDGGGVVKVRYGVGEVEVWQGLKLPMGVDAVLGVTALEKLGFRVDPKTGKLEKVELYLL